MKGIRKILSVILIAAMLCCFVPLAEDSDLSVTANAASIALNIQLLRSKFPHNKFWNHKTNNNHNHVGVYSSCRNSACNNPDGWTDYPCSTHDGVVGIGGYDCNNFDNAIQCMGFAMKLFYDVHGVTARNVQQRYDRQNVGVGDYIRMLDDTHSALVIARNGDYITVAECNLYGAGNQCKIRWDYTYHISTITYFCHSDSVGTSLHQCSYGSNFVCSGCGAFDPASITKSSVNLTFTIKSNDAIDHTGPYGACKTVNTYTKGTVVTATEKITNAHGHTWYRLTNGYYIYDTYLKAYNINYVDITLGDYRILNFGTMKYLIVDEGKDAQAQNVSVWDYSASATEEKWGITKDSLGYIITSKLGSRVLNPYADTITPGNNVTILSPVSGDITQRWKLELVTGGYVIRNAANLSCVLTVENGHNVKLDTYKAGDLNQLWQLEPVIECSHNWNSSAITKKPNCVDTGIRTYTCSRCQGTKNEIIPADGNHTFDSGTVTKNGTCKIQSEVLYKCTLCDYSYTQKEGYGNTHGNLSVKRSGAYMSVSQFTCKSCGAEYSYDLGVKGIKAEPVGKNQLKVTVEFNDNKNRLESNATPHYPATAVSSVYPNGYLCIVNGKIVSDSSSGNTCTVIVEYTDAALKQLAGDKHAFLLRFVNKNDPSNKYGYVQVIYEWHQGKYVNLKPGETVNARELLGISLDGYYLASYDTEVATESKDVITAKGYGRATFVYCNNKKGDTIGFTVVVEPEKTKVKGDADGDGKVTAADARLALRSSVNLEKLTDEQISLVDIDKDKKGTAADARMILRASVNLEKLK